MAKTHPLTVIGKKLLILLFKSEITDVPSEWTTIVNPKSLNRYQRFETIHVFKKSRRGTDYR